MLAICVPAVLVMAASVLARPTADPPFCPTKPLNVRIPTYLDPIVGAAGNETSAGASPSSKFVAPPRGWFAGTWAIRQTSGSSYLTYGNLQWDLTVSVTITCAANTTSECPTGSLSGIVNEVTTWTPADDKTALNGAIAAGNRSVASIRAYNTPHRLNHPKLNSDWDATYDNSILDGPGKGYAQSWSLLHWSLDASGKPWMVVHETPALFPNGVWVLDAIKELGNKDVTEHIEKMGDRKFDPDLLFGPAICAETCQKNQAIQA